MEKNQEDEVWATVNFGRRWSGSTQLTLEQFLRSIEIVREELTDQLKPVGLVPVGDPEIRVQVQKTPVDFINQAHLRFRVKSFNGQ